MTGIAPANRFTDVEDEYKLMKLMPDMRSVIVMCFSVNRGALRGVEEGTNWGALNAGSPTNPMVIPPIIYRFCKDFERIYHYEAICLTKLAPISSGISDKPAKNRILFFDYAAYAAGLGEISKGKFFLTEEYGIRQYFAVILTDAEIEADEIYEKNLCDGCMECVKSCPYRALDPSKLHVEYIAGHKTEWFEICLEKCAICQTGAISSQYLDDGDFNILNRGAKAMDASVEPSRIAAACGRACAAHLEDSFMKGKFINKFRSR